VRLMGSTHRERNLASFSFPEDLNGGTVRLMRSMYRGRNQASFSFLNNLNGVRGALDGLLQQTQDSNDCLEAAVAC